MKRRYILAPQAARDLVDIAALPPFRIPLDAVDSETCNP